MLIVSQSIIVHANGMVMTTQTFLCLTIVSLITLEISPWQTQKSNNPMALILEMAFAATSSGYPLLSDDMTPIRLIYLTHWGRVTHKCVSNLTIIGSENGLSPGRRQAFFWTITGMLLIRTLETNFSKILSEIDTFPFKKMHFKMSSAKWRPFCLGLNVLSTFGHSTTDSISSVEMAFAVTSSGFPYISRWCESIPSTPFTVKSLI